MYRNRFWSDLVMGHELGSATDIDRLLVSSGLSTPIFSLIGNDDFWSCHTDCRPKLLPKKKQFRLFLDISARLSRIPNMFGPAHAKVCHGQCFQFSSPNLQWLTRFDFKEPLSALWLAQLVYQFNLWRPWTYLW